MPSKSNFLDKILGRLPRLDKEGLQTVIERLAPLRVLPHERLRMLHGYLRLRGTPRGVAA